MNQPRIGFGWVWHARLRPVRRAFRYPVFFLLLPMRSLQAGSVDMPLARNRAACVSFHDRDHGDGRACALDWLDELLAGEGIVDAAGEVWLHCFPRVLGYAFKPVSFWYCHGSDGGLRAIVAEVNNTFGERHCYLLESPVPGAQLTARKVFHVSPFCRVEGEYRFSFVLPPSHERTRVRIDHHDESGPLLLTSVSGELEPLTVRALRRALWRYPLLTLAIAARIHWQAVRLWVARVPFHPYRSAATRRGAITTSR